MKHWTSENALLEMGVPQIVRDAADAIADSLGRIGSGGYPKLVSVSHSDGEDDIYEYEVFVDLAPGLRLPMECGLLESQQEGWEPPFDADGIVEWTMEGVEACLPIVSHLSEVLHVVRMRARRIIGEWTRSGIQSRLIEARLAPYDHWRGSVEPGIVLFIEGYDEQLRSTQAEIPIENAAALERELFDFRLAFERETAARARLAQAGASGTIDQLALNAIAHYGDVATTLRRFENEWRFWLPDSTALLMHEGEVTAGNGDANPAVHFSRHHITFSGIEIPETVLLAARGRPVTDLAEHPFLSSDMTVVEARSSTGGEAPSVTIHLDMPIWFFCTATGRTWRDEPQTAAPSGDNIVQLQARAR